MKVKCHRYWSVEKAGGRIHDEGNGKGLTAVMCGYVCFEVSLSSETAKMVCTLPIRDRVDSDGLGIVEGLTITFDYIAEAREFIEKCTYLVDADRSQKGKQLVRELANAVYGRNWDGVNDEEVV